MHSKNKGWLAPSVENRIQAHLSRIEDILEILPITSVTVETAAFDMQKIKNPEIEGEGYQQGEQLCFWNVREYVLFRDGHVCQACKGKSKDPILNVHHIESRKTGGDAPNNLITLCETCHKAYHSGKLKKFNPKRGQSLKAEAFMGIMRWTVLNRLREHHPDLPISNTYGYLTKHKRIVAGLSKTHCADAFCIAGNLDAKRRGKYLYQKQTRKHNRQIHKLTILKGGVRKRQQAPYLVKGFRLFDKVLCKGEVGFIFGRRSSGSFDVRRLDGTKISAGISYKKLSLLEKRKTFLSELRKEEAAISPSRRVYEILQHALGDFAVRLLGLGSVNACQAQFDAPPVPRFDPYRVPVADVLNLGFEEPRKPWMEKPPPKNAKEDQPESNGNDNAQRVIVKESEKN